MNKIKVIKYLLEHKEEEQNITSIAKGMKQDYKNTYYCIKQLEKENILKIRPFGKANKVELQLKNHPCIFQAEWERREQICKNTNIEGIYNYLKEVSYPYIALLFGSFAKGTSTKHSDYDLLIITENEETIQKKIKLIPLNIHATLINREDFKRMSKSREFTVVSEALKKNIVLIGIEEYYRLLENA